MAQSNRKGQSTQIQSNRGFFVRSRNYGISTACLDTSTLRATLVQPVGLWYMRAAVQSEGLWSPLPSLSTPSGAPCPFTAGDLVYPRKRNTLRSK